MCAKVKLSQTVQVLSVMVAVCRAIAGSGMDDPFENFLEFNTGMDYTPDDIDHINVNELIQMKHNQNM